MSEQVEDEDDPDQMDMLDLLDMKTDYKGQPYDYKPEK